MIMMKWFPSEMMITITQDYVMEHSVLIHSRLGIFNSLFQTALWTLKHIQMSIFLGESKY